MTNTKLARARLAACRMWPAASYAILSLIPVERRGLGTLSVDKHWRIYFDPAYLETVKDDEAALIVLHEVSHLLMRHHARAGNSATRSEADWKLWNVAADCAVNYQLQLEGRDVPKDWMTPNLFQLPGNLTAEQYYHHLQEQRDAKQQREEPEGQAQESEQQDPEDGDGPEEEPDDQPESSPPEQDAPPDDGGEGDESQPGDGSAPPDSSSDGDGSDSDGSDPAAAPPGEGRGEGAGDGADSDVPATPSLKPGESGSCADGRLRPWEEQPPGDEPKDAAKEGATAVKAEPPPVIEEHEQEQLIRRVAEAMEAKGNCKGCWSEFVQSILHPKIDPRVLLTMAIRKAVDQVSGGHDETSYRRPSRRPSQGGVIRPSRVAVVPRICVIVDSSGSMSQKDLALALGMIAKVLSGFRLRDGVRVLVGDAEVQSNDMIFDPVKLAIKGRGGTDMAVMIEAAAKLEPQPQLIVLVTDGETNYPEQSVGVPTVACLTRKPNSYFEVPSWIKSIVLV